MSTRCVKGLIRTLGLLHIRRRFVWPSAGAGRGQAIYDLHRAGDVAGLSVDRRKKRVSSRNTIWTCRWCFVTPGAPSVAAILSGDSEVAVDRRGEHHPTLRAGQQGSGFDRRHQEPADPQHYRQARHQDAGAIKGQTHRRVAHRQQSALFRGAGAAPLWYRLARRELYSGRRRARDPGGVGRARHRCRGIDCPDRRSGAQAWVITTSSTAPT